jgi:hypothetical protein
MLPLKRGSEYRYLRIGPGFHRTVVMAALGYETVPATFQQPFVINLDNVDYWPRRVAAYGLEKMRFDTFTTSSIGQAIEAYYSNNSINSI